MGRRPPQLTALEAEFVAQLKSDGKTASTLKQYRAYVRRFIRYIGNTPLDRVSEAQVRDFFEREFAGKRASRHLASVAISEFLKFAVARLPVVVAANGQGFNPPVPAAVSEKELELRRQWEADKREAKREAAEDITAKLARQVIEAYLYFQSRLNEQGSAESIDELMRLRDNAQELIQTNLALFISLSAQGKNLHPIIDVERIKR